MPVEGSSGTRFVILFAIGFVLLSAFFLFVVPRAAPDPVEDPDTAPPPATAAAPTATGKAGGRATLLISVGGVAGVGVVARRQIVRHRRS